MKVRANSVYKFYPAPLDRIYPCYRVGELKKGEMVRVVNLPGCPKANTMNHCHIQNLDGEFMGLVCCDSLEK